MNKTPKRLATDKSKAVPTRQPTSIHASGRCATASTIGQHMTAAVTGCRAANVRCSLPANHHGAHEAMRGTVAYCWKNHSRLGEQGEAE